jgi:hypothetical protein
MASLENPKPKTGMARLLELAAAVHDSAGKPGLECVSGNTRSPTAFRAGG